MTLALAEEQPDKTTEWMLSVGLFETSDFLRSHAETRTDRYGIVLLARLRLRAFRNVLASTLAASHHIDKAHLTGCPFCGANAEALPQGETEAHYLVECPHFEQSRADAGLDVVIAAMRIAPHILAYPDNARSYSIYLLLIGGHINDPRIDNPPTAPADPSPPTKIRTPGWTSSREFLPVARFLYRAIPARRAAVEALRTAHAKADPGDALFADPFDLGDWEAMDAHHPDMLDLANLPPPEEGEFAYPFDHDGDDPAPLGEHLQEPDASAVVDNTTSDDDAPAEADVDTHL